LRCSCSTGGCYTDSGGGSDEAEPFLGIEIYLIRFSHFLLFFGALALNLPWWAVFAAARLVGLGVLGCFYEASIVLPVARILLRRENITRQDLHQDELRKD
jgi:hypothetical protein